MTVDKPTVVIQPNLPEQITATVQPVDGFTVFRWPEFKAFAERLGLDLSKPIKTLVFDVRIGCAPSVWVEYIGRDAADG